MVLGVDASRAAGPRTGVGRIVEYLLGAWGRDPGPFEEIRVFSPVPLDDIPEQGALRIEVVPGTRTGLLWEATRLRARAQRVDAFFAPYVLPPGFRGRSVVYNLGIYEGSYAIGGWRARAYSRHMAWSARRADRVLAICPTTSADLIRHYGTPPDKISVAWPGLDASFRPAPESEPSTNDAARRLLGDDLPYVLFVGKFSPRRNVPALLEAFAGVAESRPDLRLVFVGPRSSDVQVERLAAEYGIDDRVLHVVDPQRGDLRTLFAQARAFAMPTEAEGFSLTILEAMASGCPVLTLKGAALGVLEYLDGPPGHESGGPVLEAEDASPDGLARALERLVDDDRLRAELAERGIQAAATFPSWDDTARKIIECLAEVAGLDRPAVPRRVGTPG